MQITDCRFHYPRREHVEPATLDDRNGFQNRRLDKWTVCHNRYLTACNRCNTEVALILSGLGLGVYDKPAAAVGAAAGAAAHPLAGLPEPSYSPFSIEKQVVAVVYYITNYVAKDDMTEKHCNEMMRLAFQKECKFRAAQREHQANFPDAPPGAPADAAAEERQRGSERRLDRYKLLARTSQRCVNKLVASREVPASMLLTHLQGWGDHYVLHTMKPLITGPFVNFLGGKPERTQPPPPPSRSQRCASAEAAEGGAGDVSMCAVPPDDANTSIGSVMSADGGPAATDTSMHSARADGDGVAETTPGAMDTSMHSVASDGAAEPNRDDLDTSMHTAEPDAPLAQGPVGVSDLGELCERGDLVDYRHRPRELDVVPPVRFFERFNRYTGEPTANAMRYDDSHPNVRKYYLTKAETPSLLYFLGPMPDAASGARKLMEEGDDRHFQFRCMWIAMLFFPWRQWADLIDDRHGETWSDALHRLIVDHATYLEDRCGMEPDEAEQLARKLEMDMNAFVANVDIRLQGKEMDADGVLEQMQAAQAIERELRAEMAKGGPDGLYSPPADDCGEQQDRDFANALYQQERYQGIAANVRGWRPISDGADARAEEDSRMKTLRDRGLLEVPALAPPDSPEADSQASQYGDAPFPFGEGHHLGLLAGGPGAHRRAATVPVVHPR
jgi:hypothetical protein